MNSRYSETFHEDKYTDEGEKLKKRVDGLTQQPSAVKQQPERAVVVGDRLVKDLDERKLGHTEARYQWDARITDAMAKVKNLPGNYHHIAQLNAFYSANKRNVSNSIRNKFGPLKDVLEKCALDVLALRETKLDDSFHDGRFEMEGFSLYQTHYTDRSGGLMMPVCDDITHRIDYLEMSYIEHGRI